MGVDLKVLLGNCFGFLWVYTGNIGVILGDRYLDQLPCLLQYAKAAAEYMSEDSWSEI